MIQYRINTREVFDRIHSMGINNNSTKIILKLFKAGIIPTQYNWEDQTILTYLCKRKISTCNILIQNFIFQYGTYDIINFPNKWGDTPIKIASGNKYINNYNINLLLSRGANLNIKNKYGLNALHTIFFNQLWNRAILFIKNGLVNVNFKSNIDNTSSILFLTQMNDGSPSYFKLMQIMLQKCNNETLTCVNYNGDTILSMAIKYNVLDIVKYCVTHNIHLNYQLQRYCPMALCILYQRLEMFNILKQSTNVDFEIFLNTKIHKILFRGLQKYKKYIEIIHDLNYKYISKLFIFGMVNKSSTIYLNFSYKNTYLFDKNTIKIIFKYLK
jgi:ankyrin repeat protein